MTLFRKGCCRPLCWTIFGQKMKRTSMDSSKAMRNGCILEKLPVDFAAMHTVLHVYDSHSAIKEWFKGDISWGQNLPKTLFMFLQEMHIFSLGSPWSCLRSLLTFCGKSSLNHHLRRHVYFLTILSASISGNFSEHWNPKKRQARLSFWMSGSTRCLVSNIFCRCQKSLELKRFNIR